jgi:HEAT repeat protein
MERFIRSILLLCPLVIAGCGQDQKSTPELIDDLKGGGERERVIAARSLKGEDEKVVPALIAALKDDDVDVRLSAAIKLGMLGGKAVEAIPMLQTALSDRDARVRIRAGQALTRIDPARFPTPPKGEAHKSK